MRLARRNLPLAMLAGAVTLGGVALGLRHPGTRPALVGRQVPQFQLPCLPGTGGLRALLNSQELRGRDWVMTAWASWCAPCREEHPVLMQVARSSGLPWLGLVHRDDPRAADEWLLRLGNPYEVNLLDTDGRVGEAFGLIGVPETFVVDRTGIVRLRHTGPMTRSLWREQLQPRLRDLTG